MKGIGDMVHCLKLITGEEIIAEVTPHNQQGVFDVEKPFQVIVGPGANGSISVAMVPFLVYARDKKFTIGYNIVIMEFEPGEQLRAQYAQAVSGIVIPEPPKITLAE